MFEWLKRKTAAHTAAHVEHPLRATLFGDVPLAAWGAAKAEEPWARFADAAASMQAGDRAAARVTLGAILERPGLESRHYLQAWDALRALGQMPDPTRTDGQTCQGSSVRSL